MPSLDHGVGGGIPGISGAVLHEVPQVGDVGTEIPQLEKKKPHWHLGVNTLY